MPRSPKTKLPKVSRPPLERMQRIHHALAKGGYPNCTSLARMLEVSPKTVQRDIDFMRDRQDLPIEFDRVKNGYYYTEPVEALPSVQVSEGEVVALYVAQKVLAQYRGTRFEKPLAAAFEKLTAGLQDSISFPLAAMDDAISFKVTGTTETDLEVFDSLHQAITAREEAIIEYKSLKDRRFRSRWVQPYHLLGASNSWYLIGFDREKDAFRVFALPRIRSVQLPGTPFRRMTDFNPKDLMQGALGVFIGTGNYRIRIRFDHFASQLVREREWHETQKIKELPEEEIEVTMTLNSLFEVERWILSWGPHARVIEPPELREQILAKAQGIVAAYSGNGTFPSGSSIFEWEPLPPDDMFSATTDPRGR